MDKKNTANNPSQLDQIDAERSLKRLDVRIWNHWRLENPEVIIDLVGGANLQGAKLQHAKLQHAKLQGAKLRHANLQDANLRDAVGFLFDGNPSRRLQISPNSRDPWSILRRRYSGPKMLFNLLLLSAFALPYLSKTLYWAGVNRSQEVFLTAHSQLNLNLSELASKPPPPCADSSRSAYDQLSTLHSCLTPPPTSAELFRDVSDQLSTLQPCLAPECQEFKIWELLIGVDQGWKFWVLAIGLLLYNLGRGLLTWFVTSLRDEAETNQHYPKLKEYLWLYKIHRVVNLLLIVAVASGLFNAWIWLNNPVWIPS